MRKINVDTDIRLAMTGATRRSTNQHRSEFDPRKFLKDATAAARDMGVDRFQSFGCTCMASRIKPASLDVYAQH